MLRADALCQVFINLAVQLTAVGAIDVGKYGHAVFDLGGRKQDSLVVAHRGHKLPASIRPDLLTEVLLRIEIDDIALQEITTVC